VNAANATTSNWENVSNWAGQGADTHYSLTVNLGAITSILGVSLDEAKFTMGCGNDMIKGDFTKGNLVVPDGSVTLILLGLGLGALPLIRRRSGV
jgi:hypothetical protein